MNNSRRRKVTSTTPTASLELDDQVLDDAEQDATVPQARYDISSYGIDFDVEGLVRRLSKHQIVIPTFQRSYVWSIRQASRFIESLLLGLPVPGIFLAKDDDTSRMIVVDGQQRLKSLWFFIDGQFKPRNDESKSRVFKLENVVDRFEGATYSSLTESDRRVLDDSVLHATVIRQDAPADNDTSIYHVFERLNSGGQKLTAQEIRAAIIRGPFIDLVRELNSDANWRRLFGSPHDRLKDEELILRFFALLHDLGNYERPMAEFLSKFAKRNRRMLPPELNRARTLFTKTMRLIFEALGEAAFRPERTFNAAVFDSIAIGAAKALAAGCATRASSVRRAITRIRKSRAYAEATSRSTADEKFVRRRIKIATDEFKKALCR